MIRIRKVAFVLTAMFALSGGILIANSAVTGEAKFVPLLNGKNLDGWMTKGNWLVQKDGLFLKPRAGEKGWQRYGAYLWTKKQYGNYVLDLEYKHPKGGNSGVFVRVKDVKNPVNTGIEVQILDSFGKKGKLTHHDCGGVIRTAGPTKNAAKPSGEWNRMIVTCQGNTLKVKLNGQQIQNLDLSKTPMKDRPLIGYVGIQDHGQPFWVRNIRIKELK